MRPTVVLALIVAAVVATCVDLATAKEGVPNRNAADTNRDTDRAIYAKLLKHLRGRQKQEGEERVLSPNTAAAAAKQLTKVDSKLSVKAAEAVTKAAKSGKPVPNWVKFLWIALGLP